MLDLLEVSRVGLTVTPAAGIKYGQQRFPIREKKYKFGDCRVDIVFGPLAWWQHGCINGATLA